MIIFLTYHSKTSNFVQIILDKASYAKICNGHSGEIWGMILWEARGVRKGVRKERATKQFADFLGESQ